MAKKIVEQPKAFRDTVFPRIRDGRVVLADLHVIAEELKAAKRAMPIFFASFQHIYSHFRSIPVAI